MLKTHLFIQLNRSVHRKYSIAWTQLVITRNMISKSEIRGT